MGPSVHRRSPTRRYSSDGSDSPVKTHRSPRRISSSRREISPRRRRSSPRTRSPRQVNSSQKTRLPENEKVSSLAMSPDRRHASRSPSPGSKRLNRAQIDREFDRERRTSGGWEDDRGRHRDHGAEAEYTRERKKEKNYDLYSGSRHDRSISPRKRERNDDHSLRLEREQSDSPREGSHNQRSRHVHSSSLKASGAGGHNEVSGDIQSLGAGSGGSEQVGYDDSVSKMKAAEDALEAKQKQKPSFELSGKLAEETNRVRGVTLLFSEPPDARKPDIRWRFYVFKAGEVLNEPLYVHRQSCYLFGRERRVADIPTDHPSCSKQHAVVQYRLVEKEQPDGALLKQVRPYLMDLGSTNGTFINDNRIEPQRYYELFEKDTIKFGNSRYAYVSRSQEPNAA